MSSCPRPLLLLAVAVLLAVAAGEQGFTIDFSSFTLRNLTLLGDSFIRNGVVGLTRELAVPAASAGTVLCNAPVKFFDADTNTSASFSTRFSFTIDNLNPDAYGDGLAFFLSPANMTLGSPGAYLGLFNSSPDPAHPNKIIAVEFDTRSNAEFNDPIPDHVGLDLGSPASIKTADPEVGGVSLRSGNVITSWIEYSDSDQRLMVWLSYSNVRPEKPILSVKSAAISKLYREFMYVGFSGSMDGSTENHKILDWTFHSYGVKTMEPKSLRPSYNVSDSSLATPFVHGLHQPVPGHGSSKKLALWLGVAGPVAFIAMVAMIALYTADHWKAAQVDPDVLKGPRQFTYREIKVATKGFHSSRVVGHGAFGKVYKAVFVESGLTFAVKRSKHTHEGKEEFLSELTAIAGLRHKNLLQLQGWCAEKGELILVYEFMENGTLDKALHEGGVPLAWSERCNIAMGIASSLVYLHQECEQQVIHRDIKTSNILLDANYNPRLGDFGLAKIMDHGKSPVSTLTAGTMGYLAPEYLQYGKATEKTDVFSFGVVILEIACGRRPIFKDGDGKKMVNLVDWVWELYAEDRLIEAVDTRLNGEFEVDGMVRLLLLGLNCANPDFSLRPSMRKALQMLSEEAELLTLPRKKPSLTFTPDLPVMLQEIVAECQDSVPSSPLYEIKIQSFFDLAKLGTNTDQIIGYVYVDDKIRIRQVVYCSQVSRAGSIKIWGGRPGLHSPCTYPPTNQGAFLVFKSYHFCGLGAPPTLLLVNRQPPPAATVAFQRWSLIGLGKVPVNISLKALPSQYKGHSEGLLMGEPIGLIKVHVVQGKKLVIRDFKSSDPYVVLKLGNQVAKTKVINSCLNPVWNQEFVFSVPQDFGVLNLEVFDKDRFKADDKMGNAYVNVQPIASAARMRRVLQASDVDTNIRKVAPGSDNCLVRDSFVRCINGEIVQDMWLRLDNVESGELELKIKWVDASPNSTPATVAAKA